MARYDHAAELQNSQPLLSQHRFLVAELGRWAALNPGLVTLWAEFQSIHSKLEEEAGRAR